jgi:hypothetical protein
MAPASAADAIRQAATTSVATASQTRGMRSMSVSRAAYESGAGPGVGSLPQIGEGRTT